MELLEPALRHQVLMKDRPLSRTSCSCEPIRGHNPLPGKQRVGAAQYWQAEGRRSTVLGSTWPATTAGGLVAPFVSAHPRGRLLGLARRGRVGPLLTRCWVAYVTSMGGWPLDLCRYG